MPDLTDLRAIWATVCTNMADDAGKLVLCDALAERGTPDDLLAERGLRWCVRNQRWPDEVINGSRSGWTWYWSDMEPECLVEGPEHIPACPQCYLLPKRFLRFWSMFDADPFPDKSGYATKRFLNLFESVIWVGRVLERLEREREDATEGVRNTADRGPEGRGNPPRGAGQERGPAAGTAD